MHDHKNRYVSVEEKVSHIIISSDILKVAYASKTRVAHTQSLSNI